METVSTHSRPKAAGLIYLSASLRPLFQHTAARRRLGQDQDERRIFFCFNTQPPEGGWRKLSANVTSNRGFNTQPPEGGWSDTKRVRYLAVQFQHTAARRRLGQRRIWFQILTRFQHTAARRRLETPSVWKTFSGLFQHTAARRRLVSDVTRFRREIQFQHTAARRRLVNISCNFVITFRFQHTAARRRLGLRSASTVPVTIVSTHSRPKAAGNVDDYAKSQGYVSTHSRPKAAGNLRK